MSADWLAGLPTRRADGLTEGITSICSAHPWVISAALQWAGTGPVLIEATCNQVNQEGGYTGMTPADYRRFVEEIARSDGFDTEQIVLGGDHLGPNPWRHLDVREAMARAKAMVAAYVAAGFAKIHLDTSMGCRGEPEALSDEPVAERVADLAAVAEATAREAGLPPPVYVIGTEVPTPGGATHALDQIAVTRPEAALRTIAAHEEAFQRRDMLNAFARVIALVVQPGVEFNNQSVAAYDPTAALALVQMHQREPRFVFEAHSTDYQPPDGLAALVRDGFAILKVGPALTFALREALYGLDRIAEEFDPGWRAQSLERAIEELMIAAPSHWLRHYNGSEAEQRLLRHYSYSDRIRYYWPDKRARTAVARLLARMESRSIPETLVSQFLPRCYPAVRDQLIRPEALPLIGCAIREVLSAYPRQGH